MKIKHILLFTAFVAINCAALHYMTLYVPRGSLGVCGDGAYFVRHEDQWYEKMCTCGHGTDDPNVVALLFAVNPQIRCSRCNTAFEKRGEAYVKRLDEETKGRFGYSGTFYPNDWHPR